MKKRIGLIGLIVCILTTLFLNISKVSINAYNKTEHERIIQAILFGNDFNSLGKEQKENVHSLCLAASICLDQFNGEMVNDLKELRKTVKGVPKTIDKINFTGSGNTHRFYTHQGWDYDYSSDKELISELVTDSNFPLRKKIILETVNEVFDFGFFSRWWFAKYDKRCNSFSALLYYFHVLSDYDAVNKNGGSISGLIDLAQSGNAKNQSLIDEIIKHCEILFTEGNSKESSHLYSQFKSKLISFKSDLEYADNTNEQIKIASDLLDYLKSDFSRLAKELDFFKKAFY